MRVTSKLMPLCGLLVAILAAPSAAAATGAWRETASMSQGRTHHAAVTLPDGRVLVTGGRTASAATAPPVDSTELFDLASESWTPGPPMQAARLRHTATVLDGPPCAAEPAPAWCGTVLVVGLTAEAERFVPAAHAWVPAGTVAARIGHTATALPDGRVLVVGGRDPLGGQALASAEVYDPQTGAWTATGSLATARERHAAAPLADGSVVVVGGLDDDGSAVGAAEVWDPGTGAWTVVPAAPGEPVPRFGLAGVGLTGGAALFLGGSDGLAVRRTADLYEDGIRVDGEPLGFPRVGHTATRLADGRVLVAGGVSADSVAAVSELYAVDGASRSLSGSLQLGRQGHTAARVGGLVLIAGGTDGRTPRLSGAELFDPAAEPVPGRVGDLTAEAVSSTAARLGFGSVGSDGRAEPPAQRYLVRQSTQPIDTLEAFDQAQPLCGGVCEFGPGAVGELLELSITGLHPGATYHWAIRAQDDDGLLGPLSNPASATTPAVLVPPFPADIRDLAVEALTHRSVELRFTAPGSPDGSGVPPGSYVVGQSRTPLENVAEFESARILCGGVCHLPVGAVGDRVTLGVAQLRPKTTYHYAVRARAADGGLGPLSNPASATTSADRVAPGRVAGLTARARGARVIRLSFRPPRSDGDAGPVVDRFDIRRASRPIDTARRFRRARRLCGRRGCRLAPRRPGGRVRVRVAWLCPGTRYHFAVRARDTAGNAGRRSASEAARTRKARRRCR